MRSDPSKVKTAQGRARSRFGVRREATRKLNARRLVLESLEHRELLATLPAALVSNPVRVSQSGGNYSSPSIAVDPTNPSNLAMVWTRIDPAIAANNQPTRVEGAISTNGGASWTAFSPYTIKLDPSTLTGTPALFAATTDAAVDFDRNGNFHVVVAQHSADNGTGEIQYNRFSLGNLATPSATAVLTSWISSVTPINRALRPTIAVDKGVASFTDTDVNGNPYTQTTSGAGNVYIAWSTNDDPPQGAVNWNPNAIRMRASFNNGSSFGGTITVNAGGNGGAQRNTAPRITVSQGTGTTAGGQVTVVWDDFGTGATASTPFDIIRVQRFAPVAGVLTAVGGNVSAATPIVRGRQDQGGLTASAAQPLGIGPAPAIASDNTLGAFSPFQGRLYLTYVDRFDNGDNPATNTDIYLRTSDNGGASWSGAVRVNDDVGVSDGFSGAAVFGGPTSTLAQGGRAQFMPSVAVDQATGTLVITYADTRYDAAQARVATTIATSIDGGATFGPQTFANASQTVLNQATGQTEVLGPVPDNNSGGNNMQGKDGTFGFGDRQGLAVLAGRVYPAWSSNANGGTDGRELLRIRVGQATIASGPRIEDGTMGPVTTTNVNGTPEANSFQVTFDRRVDPGTFGTNDVQVLFTSPTGVTSPVAVTSVTPLDAAGSRFGATQFRVNFTPSSAVGTYSYSVGPNISDRIRTTITTVTPVGPRQTVASTDVPKALPDVTTTTSILNIAGFPANRVIADMRVNLTLTHTFDDDLIITLIAPDGTRVLLSNRRGLDGQNYTNTTFDDAAGTPIAAGVAPFTGSFSPDSPLAQLLGKGVNGTWTLEIADVANLDFGNLLSWSLNFQLGTLLTSGSNGNAMDQNGNARSAQSTDFFAAPRPTGNSPFTGPFQRDTLPLIVYGPRVIGSSVPGQPVTADNLVLNGTVSALDVTFDRDMNPATFEADGRDVLRIQGPAGAISGPFSVTALNARTFRIGFPRQQLSGTYTITLGSDIRSTAGDLIDTDQDAGVDVLRGTSTSPPVPITTQNNVPVVLSPGKTVTSTILITDNFTLQALTLRLNITHPNDPDLSAELVAPDGTVIPLFSGVGTTGTRANFTNTIFDDTANTPIANGGPPFFGRFRPQSPLGVLNGASSVTGPGGTGVGVYTLRITNNGTANGTLSNWALTLSKPVSGTGLGELVADRTALDFRIFTMDPTNPLASTTWTSVGPAAIAADGTGSGRIGGLAVDPSDPSGNTVYVAGATGGVWKTNNFLTNDSNGPIYIPLTDFGPTLGVNIGGIAVFGRNNDPNQSVVIVSTGDGDGGIPGVGFLRSMDAGATWTLLDSTNNNLPFALRDHAFVGSTSFKVVADPNPSPSGQVIIYAALSGGNGGVWRSVDTGNTWVRARAGQATDVLLDPGSGPVDAVANPTGNLQVVYGAFRGDGVYVSPNQGQVWSQLAGGVGNPLEQDPGNNNRPVPVLNQGATPNGGKGRIVLAKPALVPSSEPNSTLKNLLYQGWLYAYVATPDNFQDGLYVTKDQGQNWTRIRIPGLGPINSQKRVVPTNDTGLPDYDVLGDPAFQGQGNYDIAITIDPTDPNVVYLGGFGSQPSGFVRVDISGLGDPHAYYLANDRPDGGTLNVNATDGATLKQNPLPGVQGPIPFLNLYGDPRSSPTVNLVRNPFNPLGGSSTFYTPNISSLNNTGAGVRWVPIDGFVSGADIHRLLTIRDPLTGKARLIIGNDHGVWSTVDNGDGTIDSGIGSAVAPSLSRNGNLQITQFYYGAAQPSSAAAQIAQALFYGQAQDDGFPRSTGDVLTTGNIFWGNSARGDGAGVATDQTGSGTLYQYNWPCCGGNKTDFFQVNGVGRTFGLIQQSGTGQVPDPQWPNTGGFNFAVNPVNGRQIVISSAAGRVFRTQDQGQFWLVIGDPAALDSTNAQALAYGAPLPSDPTGALDNFIYAGTVGGRIFVTFNGGGANGNAWTNISAGLDGSAVQSITTNPTRGSREAYAVTSRGVYYMADSGATGATWQNITSNVFQITQAPFGIQSFANPKLQNLNALTADWRYVIPDNLANPTGSTHPMLYVAGNGGVYRSTDKGQSWSLFPTAEPGSFYASPNPAGPNAGLPNADVRDLDLSLGNIDPTNGRPVAQPGDPNILLATTYGRGSFAIRLAPVVFANSLKLDPALPAPSGSAGGTAPDGTPLSTVARPVFDGLSQQTAFGNVVRITLVDYTDPANPRFIGGYDGTPATDTAANRTDSTGRFAVQVDVGAFTSNGLKTIGVQATDASGTKGNIATFTFTLQAQLVNVNIPPIAPTIQLLPADDSSGGLRITNVQNPRIVGVTDPNVTVRLFRSSGGAPTGPALATTTTDANGNYTLVFPSPGDGPYVLQTVATNSFGSSNSQTLSLQIKTNAPTTVPTVGIRPADDTGFKGDGLTSNRMPHFDGTAEPLARIQLFQVVNGVRNPVVLATTTADASGNFTIQFPNALSNGSITLQVGETDVAGNPGPFSTAATISIVTITGDYSGVGATTPALFRRDPAGTGVWFIQGVSPTAGIPFGSSTLDVPFSGDFDGDGKADLAVYRPSTTTWVVRKASGVSTFSFGSPGDIPVVGDFEGTGIIDVAAYTPTTGVWRVASSTGVRTFSAVVPAQAGDIPVPGDYGGDGGDDLAVYRPSTGQFFIQGPSPGGGTLTTLVVKTAANAVGDVPVPGAYDNTASVRGFEPAVFNPTTGRYTILGPGNVTRTIQFQPGDVPAPGDYTGSGKTQAAVVRGGTSDLFLIDNGAGGTTQVGSIGKNGDVPVLAPLSYRNVVSLAPTLSLASASDSGIKGDNITSVRRPVFTGVTDPGAIVDLLDTSNGQVLGTGTANASGAFQVTLSPTTDLLNRTYAIQARAHGVLGTAGPVSPVVSVTLVTVDNDFTGAARASQGLFRRTGPSLGQWFINNGFSTSFGAGGLDVPAEGDLDADGKVDLVLFRPSTGQFFAQLSGSGYTGRLLTTTFVAQSNDIPLVGNFSGTGRASVAVYRPSTGAFFIDGQTAPITFTTARSGDVPVAADFQNVGRDQLAIYRPSNSQWTINGQGGAFSVFFGGTTDVPVPGVYDAPAPGRRAQLAVYRPSTGEFFVRGTTGNRLAAKFAPNDIPVPGDYDNIGLTEPAVFRPSTRQWLVLSPSSTTPKALPNFGGANDIPTNAPYRYRALPNLNTGGTVVTRSVVTAAATATATASASANLTPPAAPAPTGPARAFRARRTAQPTKPPVHTAATPRAVVAQGNAVKKPGQLF